MTQGVTNTTSSQVYGAVPTQSSNQAAMGKDDFLKLLTYQLKAQDPLQPYDNQQFAAQLAQFSQLEQLTDIRSLIEEQVQGNQILSQTISNSALPGLLGKNAKALTNNVKFDGDSTASLGYSLAGAASSATLNITDSSGRQVRSVDLTASQLANGDHEFSWDGKDNNGNTLEAGTYSFSVTSTDGAGAQTTANCFIRGSVQSVRFKAEGTMLVIGGLEVPLQNVQDVSTGS